MLSARLRNAYGHQEAAVQQWRSDLGRLGTVFSGILPDVGPRLPRPGRRPLIALAVGAGTIITGDRHLLTLGTFCGVRMLTARAFLAGG